jgi:hypothetical protein
MYTSRPDRSAGRDPQPRWRNWQTRQLEVLVGVKSRGGSSPLLGIHVDDPLAILAGVVVVPETAINRRPLETARST